MATIELPIRRGDLFMVPQTITVVAMPPTTTPSTGESRNVPPSQPSSSSLSSSSSKGISHILADSGEGQNLLSITQANKPDTEKSKINQKREPEKLRDWLAREIKDRFDTADANSRSSRSSLVVGGEKQFKKTGDVKQARDFRLKQRHRNSESSSDLLDALLRGQRSWLEQKTVIVDIDNSSRRQPTKRGCSSLESKTLDPSIDLVEETTNAISRDKSSNLAVGSQLKPNSSAKQPEGFEAKAKASESREIISVEKSSSPIANKPNHPQSEPKIDGQIGKTTTSANESAISLFKADTGAQQQGTGESERVNQSKNRRLPTFGSIPRTLSRFPYFSYYGKARNVDIITPTDRNQALEVQVHSDGSRASLSSTSSRSLSSPASASRIPVTQTRISNFYNRADEIEDDEEFGAKSTTRGQPKRAINWNGYSNISNLFPSRPSLRSRTRDYSLIKSSNNNRNFGDRRQSNSLLNLNAIRNNQQTSGNNKDIKESHISSRLASSSFALDRSRTTTDQQQQQQQKQLNTNNNIHRNRSTSTTILLRPSSELSNSRLQQSSGAMRRQNKLGTGNLAYGVNRQQANSRTGTYRGRPSSSASGYLTKQHRSPSASSLHYNSSGIGLSPYGPPILDPDCPVHGYPSPTGVGQTSYSKSTQNIGAASGGADVDLLYDNYGNYYDTRAPLRNRATSLYSPTSPNSPTFGLRSQATNMSTNLGPTSIGRYNSNNPTNAYYNSSSRFSLYHPSESGPRSQLAPTNEQLRRILGYQPPTKPIHLHPQWAFSRPFIHLQSGRSPSPQAGDDYDEFATVRYEPYNQLQDAQAIRAVDFHPSGEVYAIGSNSRALRICAYPADHELRHFSQEHELCPPRVLFKFLQVHRGSIYCVSFNGNGRLLATGSNDQTVHIVRYNPTTHSPDGDEYRLTMHDGTVRDLCFIDDSSNGSSLLLSAGGGDNKIYVTDCDTITPFQSMAGHSQMIMSLSHLAGATFVSASYDKTIRFWDLRTRACTSIISAPPNYGTSGNWVGPGAPVCAVKVDPTGRLLASGHSDSTCMLYDVRSARIVQTFRPHDDEIRTLSFSPKSYYLLTGGYDGRVVVSDLQGDIAQPLPSVCVAECDDKIVQAKWHPSDFTFATTSADRTATLWALPTE